MIGLLGLVAFSGPPAPGDQLAPFELSTIDRGRFAWRPGRATVVEVVAYWCDTWKTQFQRLDSAARRWRGLPVDAVAISIDGRWREVARGGSWGALALDPGGAWARDLGIDRVPFTLVVDRAGVVRYARSGVVRSEDVFDAVRDALSPKQSATFSFVFVGRGGDLLLDELRRLAVRATFVDDEIDGVFAIRARAAGHSVVRTPPRGALDLHDEEAPGTVELVRRLQQGARAGGAVSIHPASIDALPDLVDAIRRRGWATTVIDRSEGSSPASPGRTRASGEHR